MIKKNKFKKGEIVFGKSQDYGDCIVQLVRRITKNVKGEVMKSPIWYCYILDTNKERDLMNYLIEQEHLVGFFEDLDKNNFMQELNSEEVI
jgi:hypothetical protein